MAYVLSSISGNLISAASAGFAPTNSADVSAIASAYATGGVDESAVSAIASSYAESAASGKVDSSAVGTYDYYGTALVTTLSGSGFYAERALRASTDVLDRQLTALAAESSLSGKQDASSMSAYQLTADMSGYYTTANESGYVDSAYVDSAVSSKQDTLTFAYNEDSAISSINGSALAGGGVTGDYLTAVVGSDRARIATAFQDGNNNRPSLLISAEREAARSTWPRMILTDWNRTTGLNHSGVLLADGFEFYQCSDSAYGQVSPSGIKRARLDPTNLQFLVNTAISSDEHSANYGRSGLWFFPTGGSALSISISSDTSVGPFIQLNDNSGLSGKMMVSSIGYWNSKADSSSLSSYVPYSSLEYNTASAISGINGSALAAGSTYSAGEGIDITDDVISVETPVDIVAGPGIVIDNPDGNTLRVSADENYETVLWEGTLNTLNSDVSCSESIYNFDRIKVFYRIVADSIVQSVAVHEFEPSEISSTSFVSFGSFYLISNGWYGWWLCRLSVTDNNKIKITKTLNSFGNGASPAGISVDSTNIGFIYKIVGIHRIANN